jgi:hypothetical protein
VPVLVVDVANVMGSRPDGWWRDRPAAATRLMTALAPLLGRDVLEPSRSRRTADVRADLVVGETPILLSGADSRVADAEVRAVDMEDRAVDAEVRAVDAEDRAVDALAGVPAAQAEVGAAAPAVVGSRTGSPEESLRIDRIVAVVEGKARAATAPAELEVVPAPADGDSTIVAVAIDVLAGGEVPLVVTADRALRARLPSGSAIAGPSWLLALI